MQAVSNPSLGSMDFSIFYETHARGVRAIVHQFRFYDAAADDLVQDIFIKAWRGLDQLENLAALGAWVRAIARNHCINELKNLRQQERHLIAVEILPDTASETVSEEIFEMSLQQLEEHLLVLRDLIVHHKDPVRREIARLFYVEQKSIREICLATDLKQNTVLSHLRRFRLVVTKTMQRWLENAQNETSVKSRAYTTT